jgi:hypothetical protein
LKTAGKFIAAFLYDYSKKKKRRIPKFMSSQEASYNDGLPVQEYTKQNFP